MTFLAFEGDQHHNFRHRGIPSILQLDTSTTNLEVLVAPHLGIELLLHEQPLRGQIPKFIRRLKLLLFENIICELLQRPIDVDLVSIERVLVRVHINNHSSNVLSAIDVNHLLIF